MIRSEKPFIKTNNSFTHNLKKQWPILLFLLPGIIYFIVFSYLPLYGLVGAFQNFTPIKGFFGSAWVGFKNFQILFSLPDFTKVLRNTAIIGTVSLVFGYPTPIILALMYNELHKPRFKKIVQTISYIPYFISWVVASGIWYKLLASNGIINDLLIQFGLINKPIYFFTENKYFVPIVFFTAVWKGLGFSTIMYLAALTGINPELYEAGDIDGASRWQKMRYITIPGISATMLLIFILNLSNLLNVNFEQIWTMQNQQIYEVSEVIDTYIFRIMLNGRITDYSRGIAFGLIRAGVSFILFFGGNSAMKKLGYGSLY